MKMKLSMAIHASQLVNKKKIKYKKKLKNINNILNTFNPNSLSSGGQVKPSNLGSGAIPDLRLQVW